MTTATDQAFPTSFAEMTPRWLTATLRTSGVLGADDTVSGWRATPIGVGVGMLSDIVKLELEYAAGAGPLQSLIAKFASLNPQNRAVAHGLQTYEREVRFYSELAAHVGEFCPRAYFCRVVPASGDMVLLMEDLSGYRPGDQAAGCSLPDAELALAAAARLHAATWNARERTDLTWWPRIEGPLYSGAIGAGVQALFGATAEAFRDCFTAEVLAAGDAFTAAIPQIHGAMSQGPQALIHGDFRLDNFMFGTTADHRPFVMLDMQAPIVTKSVHDVAYLLSQSMETDLRRAEERRLVADYHAELVAHGVSDYSAEQCWTDYRFAVLHCLEYAVIIGGSLEPGNSRGRAWVEASLRRSCQAIVDLDALELLP